MSCQDADRWNDRYAREGSDWLERSPCQLLLDFAKMLPEHGLALDAAAGVSSNGLFMAERGLTVISLDISETGLRLGHGRAIQCGLPMSFAVYDLSELWLPPDHFDVIINFYFLERATFGVYRQALKPGGLIYFETFLDHGADTLNPDYYLKPGELLRVFQGFEIIRAAEGSLEHRGDRPAKYYDQLIARKPHAGLQDAAEKPDE